MENKLQPTEGEWLIMHSEAKIKPSDGVLYETEVIVGMDSLITIESLTKKDAEAKATLIADAGTTYNKCGLTPSELLSQRNELLEGLQSFHNRFANNLQGYKAFEDIKSLIDKITQNN